MTVVSNVKVLADVNSATITWDTDAPTLASLFVAGVPAVAEESIMLISTGHRAVVTGLKPNTTYSFYIQGTDPTSPTPQFTSNTMSFKTLTMIVSVRAVASVSKMKVSVTTVVPTTVVVDYGPTAAYGLQVQDAVSRKVHQLDILSLTPLTLYHYKVTMTDAGGNSEVVESSISTTTATGGCPWTAALVVAMVNVIVLGVLLLGL